MTRVAAGERIDVEDAKPGESLLETVRDNRPDLVILDWNTSGQPAYKGPCPPEGTGTHHYRFTLYQLPNDYQLPGGLAGVQAAETIAGAATAQAQLVGTFGG